MAPDLAWRAIALWGLRVSPVGAHLVLGFEEEVTVTPRFPRRTASNQPLCALSDIRLLGCEADYGGDQGADVIASFRGWLFHIEAADMEHLGVGGIPGA
jgi:hypothetical protein